PILHIHQGSYYYNDDPSTPTLHNINLSLHPGDLLMVVGPVGSGKSSLLSAMLGEMKAVSPVGVAGYEFSIAQGTKVAYAAQAPFILAASVKANIVLARSTRFDDITQSQGVDEDLYAKVSVVNIYIYILGIYISLHKSIRIHNIHTHIHIPTHIQYAYTYTYTYLHIHIH
ncbi:ATP-binding cassette domain-containing protein, partial [archaeon]